MLAELGVRDYVGTDWAAPQPFMRAGFTFIQEDATRVQLGRRFDCVLAIDVAFHIVGDADFENFLDTVTLHLAPGGWCCVTGLFHERGGLAAHVRHRALGSFARIGKMHAVRPWRDTALLRMRAEN
jgi:hypothetical protein